MIALATQSTGYRALREADAPSTRADTPLNETALDLKLDPSCPVPVAVDRVEAALAKALEGAAAAGRFDVVAQLAKELEARRLGVMGNVIALASKARKKTD